MAVDFRPKILIPEQTAEVSVPATFPVEQRFTRATLVATNLANAETATVVFSVDNFVTFEPVIEEGTAVQLTATNNTIGVTSPLFLGVLKTATASAAGVFIFSSDHEKQQ